MTKSDDGDVDGYDDPNILGTKSDDGDVDDYDDPNFLGIPGVICIGR